jgi:hypothetical protein
VLVLGSPGVEQVSEVRSGGLKMHGFADNTAPDHLDRIHALARRLRQLNARSADSDSQTSRQDAPSLAIPLMARDFA